MTERLDQLVDALAPMLAELVIRPTAVSVTLRVLGRDLRLEQSIPDGEHDLVGAAEGLLRAVHGLSALLGGRP